MVPPHAETAHAGHSAYGHGPQGGAGASAVQRVKRGREESTEGEISEDAVNLIASPMGREDTYMRRPGTTDSQDARGRRLLGVGRAGRCGLRRH